MAMHWMSLNRWGIKTQKIVFYSSLLQYPNKNNKNQNIEMIPKRGDSVNMRDNMYTQTERNNTKKKMIKCNPKMVTYFVLT